MSRSRTVVVTSNIFPGLETEKEVLAPYNVELVKRPCQNQEQLGEAGKDAVALLVGNVHIDAEVISHLPHCLAIVKPSVGVDNIDIDAATAAGVCVANVPDYGTDEVATHAMALLLNAIRYVDAEATAVRGGRWQPKPPYPIQRSAGRTLGIIGFGRIGQSVARKAAGFDWRLLAWDPYLDDDEIRRGGAEPAGFENAAGGLGLCHAAFAADGRDAGNDQCERAGEDEAERLSREHGSRGRCRLRCAAAGGGVRSDRGGGC